MFFVGTISFLKNNHHLGIAFSSGLIGKELYAAVSLYDVGDKVSFGADITEGSAMPNQSNQLIKYQLQAENPLKYHRTSTLLSCPTNIRLIDLEQNLYNNYLYQKQQQQKNQEENEKSVVKSASNLIPSGIDGYQQQPPQKKVNFYVKYNNGENVIIDLIDKNLTLAQIYSKVKSQDTEIVDLLYEIGNEQISLQISGLIPKPTLVFHLFAQSEGLSKLVCILFSRVKSVAIRFNISNLENSQIGTNNNSNNSASMSNLANSKYSLDAYSKWLTLMRWLVLLSSCLNIPDFANVFIENEDGTEILFKLMKSSNDLMFDNSSNSNPNSGNVVNNPNLISGNAGSINTFNAYYSIVSWWWSAWSKNSTSISNNSISASDLLANNSNNANPNSTSTSSSIVSNGIASSSSLVNAAAATNSSNNTFLSKNVLSDPFECIHECIELLFKQNQTIKPRRTIIASGILHLLLCDLSNVESVPQRSPEKFTNYDVYIRKSTQSNSNSSNAQLSTATSSKNYWAKGTGYASTVTDNVMTSGSNATTGAVSNNWNQMEYLKLQEIRATQTNMILNSLLFMLSFNNAEQEASEFVNELFEVLQHSCLVPILQNYLRNDSLLDMGRQMFLYLTIFKLITIFSSNEKWAELLQKLPNETTSLFDLLMNLNTMSNLILTK